MTSKNVAALTAEITANFPDNTTGLVTPALLRQVTQDIVDSTNNLNGVVAPDTQTGATYTVVATDIWIILNRAGTVTVTLPAAASFTGRPLWLKTIQAQTVISNASNVVPLVGGAAGTAILAATAGKWALLVSDGTNWVIMAGN
jgi:hypothetical protein